MSHENAGPVRVWGAFPWPPPPAFPAPHSQPEKPGEALEGPGGETADPVVGEVPEETA